MFPCWKCGRELEDQPQPLPFRATCDYCGSWLHACCNCKNYKPGLPNDCAVPDTDPISDREGVNYCEDFKLLGKGPEKGKEPPGRSRFDALFGD